MARKKIERELKRLRQTLKSHAEFADSANLFFDLLEDPMCRRACDRPCPPDVEAILRASFHHAGHLAEDAPLMVMGYPPAGFYHGMLAPMVVFFYFAQAMQGLIIQTSFSGRTDYFRFTALRIETDAIPVPGNATVH